MKALCFVLHIAVFLVLGIPCFVCYLVAMAFFGTGHLFESAIDWIEEKCGKWCCAKCGDSHVLVRALTITLVLIALSFCGCTSTAGRVLGTTWGHPYVGTALALTYASDLPVLYADAPFDFVLDTALLPIDLTMMPFMGKDDE